MSRKTFLLSLLPVGLLLLLAALVQLHGQIPYPAARYSQGDHYRYIALAAQPFGSPDPLAHEAPFLWRLLTPLIVHLLPFPLLTSFWLVTLVGLAGATLALEWLLVGLKLSPLAMLAGGVAFVLLGPATGFNLWNYALVDPLALCLLALIVGCAIHRHGRLLVALTLLGALTKEVTLLGALFALAWAWKQNRALLPWAMSALIGGGALLILLRLLLPPANSYTLISAFEETAYFHSLSLASVLALLVFEASRLIQAISATWGALLPLALLQLRHTPRFWHANPAFLVLIVGSILQIFIATDVERLAVYGFPGIIAACCFEIEDLAVYWKHMYWVIWLSILLIQAAQWWLYAAWPPESKGFSSPAITDPLHRVVEIGILLATAGVLVWLLLTRKGAALTSQNSLP